MTLQILALMHVDPAEAWEAYAAWRVYHGDEYLMRRLGLTLRRASR